MPHCDSRHKAEDGAVRSKQYEHWRANGAERRHHVHRRRRPPLFALMLAAFISVIILGFCGMGTVFMLSARLSGQDFGPPKAANVTTTPTADGTPVHTSPYGGFSGPVDWRGPVSALLAFAAV